MIGSFGREICSSIITLNDALENLNLKNEIDKFKKPTKPKFLEKKEQNELTFNNIVILFEGRQKVLDGFKSKIFLIEQQAQGNGRFSGIASHLKILTLK